MKMLKLQLLLLAAWAPGWAAGSRVRRAEAEDGQQSMVQVTVDALANAALDEDLGGDVGLVQTRHRRVQLGEPQTLEDYCKGETGEPTEGSEVEADWMDLGQHYPGEIKRIHEDGKVDILYDDGFDELDVPMSRVKVLKDEDAPDTKNDPACLLQNFTKKIKKKVTEVRKQVGKWIDGQSRYLREVFSKEGAAGKDEGSSGKTHEEEEEAAEKGKEHKEEEQQTEGGGEEEKEEEEQAAERADEETKRKAAEVVEQDEMDIEGGAQAGNGTSAAAAVESNATDKQSKELTHLKEQLAAKDLQIQELEKELAETDEQIEQEKRKDAKPPTIDDLIARYKARIAERDKRIQELRAKLEKRKRRLEALRHPEVEAERRRKEKEEAERVPTLEEIHKMMKSLDEDILAAKQKRNEVRQEGKLDVELAQSLRALFQMQKKLQAQFKQLEEMQADAERRKEEARKAAREAAAEARREAEANGDDPTVVRAKMDKAREEAAKEVEAVDTELMVKARVVSQDLDIVQKTVQELDTGVHPHGAKWWRYRYEHAYLEAMLMTFVCFLMLIWERIYHYMRWKVYSLSKAKEIDRITHGTMYIGWLEFLAGELMTSLLVFLTCWVISQCHIFEVIAAHLRHSHSIHLPKTGDAYRRMLLDVCVVFFFAILMYYALALSVVHCCTKKLAVWATLEIATAPAAVPPSPSFARTKTEMSGSVMQLQKMTLASFTSLGLSTAGQVTKEAKENYTQLKEYFLTKVMEEPALMAAIEQVDLTPESFPFWVYIRLAVRRNTDKLFKFGCLLWASMIVTFISLLFLHRFGRIGCVRVMFAVFLGLIVLLLLMTRWIHKISSNVRTSKASEEGQADTSPRSGTDSGRECSIHNKFSTEEGVIFCLHFLLFFSCYLAARMICQPWMWRLHFKLVLGLTVLLVCLTVFFVLAVAPMIPEFCVALAMPPYVDPSDVKTMIEAIEAGAEMNEDPDKLSDAVQESPFRSEGEK